LNSLDGPFLISSIVTITYHIHFSPYNSDHLSLVIEAAFLTGMTISEPTDSLGI